MTRKITVLFSVLLILMFFLMAGFPRWFTSQSPTSIDLSAEFSGPSTHHILGQGENGIDLWSQIVYGAKISLSVSTLVVFFTLIIGVFLGGLGGYFGAWVDIIVVFLIDILFAFPGFLLAVALSAILGPGIKNVIFLLAITGWPAVARLVRGEVLKLRDREFIQAVHAMGGSPTRIFVKHLLPNVFPLLCIQATFSMAGVIIVESSLSFLGLGVPPGTPTWGALLAMGKNAMLSSWHVTAVPGITIMLLVLSFNLVGDWLRDYYDPKLKTKRA